MIVSFAIFEHSQGRKYAAVGNTSAEVRDKAKSIGFQPNEICTAGEFNVETGKMNRTHPYFMKDEYVARLIRNGLPVFSRAGKVKA